MGDWNNWILGTRNMVMPLLLLRYDGCTDGRDGEFNQEHRCDKINKYNYFGVTEKVRRHEKVTLQAPDLDEAIVVRAG